MRLQVRPITKADRDWVDRILTDHWASTSIVSRGKVHDAERLPGFIVLQDSAPAGLVTYRLEDNECEIVTLNSLASGTGIGSALLEAVKSVAISSRCRRIWLVTTNDNMSALRFYQKRGFTLVAVHRNALEQSRKVKPDIPSIGIDGIPLRDEIELEMPL